MTSHALEFHQAGNHLASCGVGFVSTSGSCAQCNWSLHLGSFGIPPEPKNTSVERILLRVASPPKLHYHLRGSGHHYNIHSKCNTASFVRSFRRSYSFGALHPSRTFSVSVIPTLARYGRDDVYDGAYQQELASQRASPD